MSSTPSSPPPSSARRLDVAAALRKLVQDETLEANDRIWALEDIAWECRSLAESLRSSQERRAGNVGA